MMPGMLGLRLRWYKEATAQLLMRRWQTILLASGTLAPVGGTLLVEAAYPVLVLLDPHHGTAWRMGAIGLWQGFWALWAMMQREQLRGAAFTDFARALPIGQRSWRVVDLAVLALSDTPLLIPFVSAVVALGLKHGIAWEAARGDLLVAYLLVSQMCAQLAVLHDRPQVVPGFLVANAWAAVVLGLPAPWAAAGMTIVLAGALAAMVGTVPELPGRAGQALRGMWRPLGRPAAWLFARLSPRLRLSLGILYRQHYSIMLAKFFTCMLVSFASLGLMSVWEYDSRCVPLALIASALVALGASGLYRPLQMAHDAARRLTGPLPLRRRWSVVPDTLAVASFGLPFALALDWVLWSRGVLPQLSAFVYVVSFLALLVLLRLSQLFSSRQAVVASSVLAVLWTVGTANFLQPY